MKLLEKTPKPSEICYYSKKVLSFCLASLVLVEKT